MNIIKFGTCKCNDALYAVRYIVQLHTNSSRFLEIPRNWDRSLGDHRVTFHPIYASYFNNRSYVYGLTDSTKFWMEFDSDNDALMFKLTYL